MTKSILTAAFALVMGFTTSTFAEEKGDTKVADMAVEASTPGSTSAAATATLQWFHFNGVLGQEGVASQYSPESSPECPSQNENLRCDIQAYNQEGTSLPDLDTIQQERNVED